MPDRRFNGAAPPDVALEPCGDAALEFAVIDFDFLYGGATIAQIHEYLPGLLLCQVFHLL